MGWLRDIWDRDRDGSRKEQRSFARYAIVVTALMVLFLFVKKDNVFRWIDAGIAIRKQENKIEQLKADIDRLDNKTRLLTNDRDTLERYARENLGFAEPGDDVFLIKD